MDRAGVRRRRMCADIAYTPSHLRPLHSIHPILIARANNRIEIRYRIMNKQITRVVTYMYLAATFVTWVLASL